MTAVPAVGQAARGRHRRRPGPGKLKTVFQNIFIGAIILWFAFRDARKPMGWEHSALRRLSGTSSTAASWR